MNRNWKYLATLTIVRAYLLGALVISFSHIVSAAHLLQLDGWQAWTTPFAIDGFAVLGMIARSHSFAARTRTIGLRIQVVASLLSLACNIFAGHTIGERVYGAMIVAAYVFSEWFGDQMKPASADIETAAQHAAAAAQLVEVQLSAQQEQAATERAAVRSAAAVQAAATRKARAAAEAKLVAGAEAARAAKNEARRLARMERQMREAFDATVAPVSPAPLATTYM